MAAGIKLVIQYETSNGSSTTHTWNYAKSSATAQQVKALITETTSATNRVIFQNVPIAAKSAKLVTTTETPFNLESVMASHGAGDPDMRHLISTMPPDEDEDYDNEQVTTTTPLWKRRA